MSEPMYDRVIKNVRLARPNRTGLQPVDIAFAEGRFARVAPEIEAASAKDVVDGKGLIAFPGVVDAHMHIGIYRNLAEDAPTESKCAAMGGVTTSLTYFRTGQYYLNKGGPYLEFFKDMLEQAGGRYQVDYGFHLMPAGAEHIEEMPDIYDKLGVPTFKVFMFYGGYGLHGKSDNQAAFLMTKPDERYDLAHFEFVLRGAKKVVDMYPEARDLISVSFHCENPELMNAWTRIIQEERGLNNMEAYHLARPPHSEGLSIVIAAYLAHAAGCPNINILHLTSRESVETVLKMQEVYPDVNIGREATVGHLLLDLENCDTRAKVNPPIRTREDREYLWHALMSGKIDWVVTDHACCPAELKFDPVEKNNVWGGKSGFGGTEYLLSGLYSEGRKHGLSENRIAELLSFNPAQRFGLWSKGDVAPGLDADLVLFDPDQTWTIRSEDSPSAQGYTPFEGIEVSGKVKKTYLRGECIYDNGSFPGTPRGEYIARKIRK
jgi:allantoinase